MQVTKEFWSNYEFGISVLGFSVCNHWSPCCRRRGGYAPSFEPPNIYFGEVAREKNGTCDRFVWLSHSNESSHAWKIRTYLSHVKHSNEFFTCVTNTCEFFTRLKLDICEKLVLILKHLKIGRTNISHIPKCDVFVRIIHSVWKMRNVNIKVQQSWPLGLPLCCVFFMQSWLFVFLSHVVSREVCGIRLFRFPIIAFSSTFHMANVVPINLKMIWLVTLVYKIIWIETGIPFRWEILLRYVQSRIGRQRKCWTFWNCDTI